MTRVGLLLLASALVAGSLAASAPAGDSGQPPAAPSAKKKCKKGKQGKGASVAKKKCKKKAPSPAPTPPPAVLSINPTLHNFGPEFPGFTSETKTFVVTNSGGSPNGPLTASMTGTNPGEFVISSNSCAGLQLAPSASCTLNVTFPKPGTMANFFQSAILTVSGSPGGSPSATLYGEIP